LIASGAERLFVVERKRVACVAMRRPSVVLKNRCSVVLKGGNKRDERKWLGREGFKAEVVYVSPE
jgi:hypothetical protein